MPVATQHAAVHKVPELSRRGLTLMLAMMCLVPIATIFLLWKTLPPVEAGKLQATDPFQRCTDPDL